MVGPEHQPKELGCSGSEHTQLRTCDHVYRAHYYSTTPILTPPTINISHPLWLRARTPPPLQTRVRLSIMIGSEINETKEKETKGNM
jgi:hypothetical protein